VAREWIRAQEATWTPAHSARTLSRFQRDVFPAIGGTAVAEVTAQKTVTTDRGKVVLDIPRDRNGTFDPLLIAEYQWRFPKFDRKVVSMYARGMTTREIQGHIEEIYGVEASPGLISAIAEAVMEEVSAWQNRPLEPWLSDRLHGRDPGQSPRAAGRSRTRQSSWPWRFCLTARRTFRACGCRPMRARSSGPGFSATCATQSSGKRSPGSFPDPPHTSRTSSSPSWTG